MPSNTEFTMFCLVGPNGAEDPEVVAEGVQFSDGHAVMRRSDTCTSFWDRVSDIVKAFPQLTVVWMDE